MRSPALTGSFELFQSRCMARVEPRGITMGIKSLAVCLATVASLVGVAASASQAAELKKITFVQEWPVADGFWIPWILGKEKGFYADEGIDLEIVAPPTVADTMKYLG